MSKFTRFQIGFDVHGDMQDAAANKVFFDFAKIWKPQIRICGGDVFDFRPLRKGASEDERREGLTKDFNAGLSWLKRFRPNYYLRGNHCERLWDLAENGQGVAQEFAFSGVREVEELMASMKCKMLPYHKRDGILKLGHMKVLHGFASGVYAARQTALVYGSALFGHCHTIDEHSIPGLERRVARCCGALCQLSMPYNARQMNTLRQAHGFCYGILNEKTGNYHVLQAECVDGDWLLPTHFKEL